jgi:hypothetical protein
MKMNQYMNCSAKISFLKMKIFIFLLLTSLSVGAQNLFWLEVTPTELTLPYNAYYDGYNFEVNFYSANEITPNISAEYNWIIFKGNPVTQISPTNGGFNSKYIYTISVDDIFRGIYRSGKVTITVGNQSAEVLINQTGCVAYFNLSSNTECISGSGSAILSINSSFIGANYQLYKDDQAVQGLKGGNGNKIEWVVSEVGTYKVKAISCMEYWMNNEVTIYKQPVLTTPEDNTSFSACRQFILPAIGGVTNGNLQGNLGYYSSLNGEGTRYNPGDIIKNSGNVYLYDNNGVCSDQHRINIKIHDTPTWGYDGNPFCVSNNSVITTYYFSGQTGGTFRSNSGLSLNASTGAIEPGKSLPGDYTVYYDVNDPVCGPLTGQAQVSIKAVSNGGSIDGPDNSCIGSTFTLTSVNRTGNVIGWQYSFDNINWVDIASSSSVSYVVRNISTRTLYRVKVQNSPCSIAFSSVKTVSVFNAFSSGSITSGSETICYGGDPSVINSSVEASGGGISITYKWRANGQDIPNSNTAVYNPPSGLTENTIYTRWAKDEVCTDVFVQSGGSQTVTVRPIYTAGTISTTGQTICSGGDPDIISNIVLSSGGDGQISYRWQKSTTGETNDYMLIPGENSSSYNPPPGLAETTWYRRQAKDNSCNSNFTSSVGVWKVTVHAPPTPPTVISGVKDICQGGSTTLTATGGSEGSGCTYQWGTGTIVGQNIIAGATSASYSTPALSSTTNYWVRRVGNSACIYITGGAKVEVKVYAPPTPPTGISGVKDICQGGSTTLTATGGSEGSGCTYQWGTGTIVGQNIIAGATSASYSTPALSSTTNYWVRRVGNSACINITGGAKVEVKVYAPPTPPTGISGVKDICQGGFTTLTATGGSEGSGCTYQWGTGTIVGQNIIAGATSASYSTPALSSTTNYWVRRIGGAVCNNETGGVSQLVTVIPTTSIGAINGSTSMCIGATELFTVNNVELGGGSGSWGSSNTAIATVNATTGQVNSIGAGTVNISYDIVNGCGGPKSSFLAVTVVAQPTAPAIVKSPSVSTVCAGQTLTVTTSSGAGGSGTVTDEYRFSTNNGSTWSSWSGSVPSFNAVIGTTQIQSRRISSGTGCNMSAFNTVSWTVVSQPTAPAIVKSPNVSTVCAGQILTVTTSSGAGGSGTVTDEYRFSTNNGSTWSTWSASIPNFNAVIGTNQIQSRRISSGTGCNISALNTVSWTVVAQPTAPAIVKSPNVSTVCAGQILTVTTSSGAGGSVTVTDEYRFSTNNGSTWSTWSDAIPNFNAVIGTNQIQSRRISSGTGCNMSAFNTVSWTVVAQPTAPTISSKYPDFSSVCSGQQVSATFNSGTGGVGCSDNYRYRINNGNSWFAYTPGSNINTMGATVVIIQGQRSGCSANTGCNETGYTELARWDVSSQLVTGVDISANKTFICEGEEVTFTATPTNGGTNPTYQWKVGAANVGNNRSTYSYTPANGDVVTCIMTSTETCVTGSPATSNAIILEISQLLNPTVELVQPTCTSSAGTITVTSPIGTGYTYSIDGADYTNTTGIFDPVPTGSYTVTAKNPEGCVSQGTTATIEVVTLAPNAPTGPPSQTYCSSEGKKVSDLTATLTGTHISWYDAAQAGNNIDETTTLATGNYYASQTVTECESTERKAVTVTVNLIPVAQISSSDADGIVCSGDHVTLSSNYSDGNLWSNGETTQSIEVNPTETGSCTLTVTQNGCTSEEASLELTVIQPLVISIGMPVNESFYGANDGQITINSITGGNGGAIQLFLDGQLFDNDFAGSLIIDALAAGNHYLLATEDTGCNSDTLWFTIAQPQTFTFTAHVAQHESAPGAADGIIVIDSIEAGQTLSFEYTINNGQTWKSISQGSSIPNLPVGTYSIQLRSGNIYSNTVTLSILPSFHYIDLPSDCSIERSIKLVGLDSNKEYEYQIEINEKLVKDALIASLWPNANGGSAVEIPLEAWTDGAFFIARALIDFIQLKRIPEGTQISRASLMLFNTDISSNGFKDGKHNPIPGVGRGVIRRVVSPWDEYTVTYNTCPQLGEIVAYIPQPTTAKQDFEIDVTEYVRSYIANKEGNFGLHLQLEKEERFRIIALASSDNPDPANWPRLDIEFVGESPLISDVWNDLSDSHQISELPKKDFIMHIREKDAIGIKTLDVSEYIEKPITINLSNKVDVSLLGNDDGEISILSVTGGADGNKKIKLNDDNDQIYIYTGEQLRITGLEAGDYYMIATDTSGCDSEKVTFTIAQPQTFTFTAHVAQHESAPGAADGIIVIDSIEAGQTLSFEYTINNGQTWHPIAQGDSITDLTAGTYTIILRAQGVETEPLAITIEQTCSSYTFNIDDLTVCGDELGFFNATGLDPNKQYEYQLIPKSQAGKPIITILGDNPLIWPVGELFVDPGATAYDAKDGDISNAIVITNNIDINTEGTYQVTYNVTDSDGYAAEEVVRVVNVVEASNWTYEGVMTVGEDEEYYGEIKCSWSYGYNNVENYSFGSLNPTLNNLREIDWYVGATILGGEIIEYSPNITIGFNLSFGINSLESVYINGNIYTDFQFHDYGDYSLYLFNTSLEGNPFPPAGETCEIKLKYTLAPQPELYTLTVNNGSGSGEYTEGDVVEIVAGAPAEGYQFKEWVGDVQYLASTTSSTTNLTMPASNISVEATYKQEELDHILLQTTKQTNFSISITCSTYNTVTIDWGDGTETVVKNNVNKIKTWASGGTQTVKIIGDLSKVLGIMSNSQNLTLLEFPESVVNLNNLICEGNQLTSLTLPSGITTMNNLYCSSNQLTSLTLPSGITTMNNLRCNNSPSLTSVNLSNLQSIGTLDLSSNASLKANVDITGLTSVTTISFAYNGASSAEVNAALARALIVAQSDASCTFTIGNWGTGAAANQDPTGQGFIDRITLQSIGWIVDAAF